MTCLLTKKFINEKGLACGYKLIDDNFIFNLINDYKEYLATLSIYELCILIDFLLIMFIFTCLNSIIFAFYCNFLINKFSLEEKFPKLSKIIKLREKSNTIT